MIECISELSALWRIICSSCQFIADVTEKSVSALLHIGGSKKKKISFSRNTEWKLVKRKTDYEILLWDKVSTKILRILA